ncbi:MAG TPA: hypothetical protein VG387_19095 [Rhizomicrobium sp.]|jgi:hypothetical protein|nr:hypothetical protein [Rhizomicrobium sp.]
MQIEQVEVNGAETPVAAKAEWSRPNLKTFDVGKSETANTNSNFDGTNFSS